MIKADTFWATTGGFGQGIKIGVVDDGVDGSNPFFNPAGFSYPAGFPKGARKFTTPKVIVARSFPGPGSGAQGRLPLWRPGSFHGTHVAGIAAGVAGTVVTAEGDHPAVSGLSGIAPRAWIGNYRVFNVPVLTGGLDAFTPQIVLAFESAVNDGMDVINFSGGGPEADPSSDALIQALENVAAAGVVPVISAGNDRDDFGLGSVGSPSNAPSAISVAASSNLHVFGPELAVTNSGAPAGIEHVPFAYNFHVPTPWEDTDQPLVDVGTITGTDGKPVERHACGSTGSDPNDPRSSTLPARSLAGVVALVSRGGCTFDSKVERVRAAGADGIILVDNRFSEPNQIPIRLGLSAGMISDLDGANIRAFMAANGGRATFRVSGELTPHEIQTGRSGVITSFSSAGPTNFDHRLKPDVTAPGGQILSSTLQEFAGAPFAVFDGTSMAAPHVSGAAALLLQQHPGWTPEQVKSALTTSAAPAWGDTARTHEASVLLEGGGLIDVAAADNPSSSPTRLALVRLPPTTEPAVRSPCSLSVTDAGGGGGAWTVCSSRRRPRPAPPSAVPSSVTIAPGGDVDAPVVAAAARRRPRRQLRLRRPRPRRRPAPRSPTTSPSSAALARAPRVTLKRSRSATRARDVLRRTTASRPRPFGPPPDYTGQPFNEDGAEHVYTSGQRARRQRRRLRRRRGAGRARRPVVPRLPDENDVQGYAGTPVNVNGSRSTTGSTSARPRWTSRARSATTSPSTRARDRTRASPCAGPYVLRCWERRHAAAASAFLTTACAQAGRLLARGSRPIAGRASTRSRS